MMKYFFILIFLVSCHFSMHLHSQHWSEVNPDLGAVTDIFESGGTLYTISNIGLYGYSDDNGISWGTDDIYDVVTLPDGITTCISFFDQSHGLIGVRNIQTGSQLLKTGDSPLEWEVASPDYDENCSSGFIPISLFKVNDSTMILDGLQNPNYRITHDRGENWQCVDNFSGGPGIQAITIRSDSEWLINDGEGLHKTTDGGETWTRITNKNFVHYQQLEQVVFGLTLYIDEPDDFPVMYKTTDDFQTVETIPLTQFEDMFLEFFVAVTPTEFYVLANGDEIYYSNNGGESFTFLQTLSNQPFKAKFLNGNWYLFGRGLWTLDENSASEETASISDRVNVFPNPVSDYLHIGDHSMTTYELHSVSGAFIRSGRVDNTQIDLSQLSSGIYTLKLSGGTSLSMHKVIKL